MEELFSTNLYAIYVIASLAVISYTNFEENQRMFILYILTYAISFFQVFRITYSIILLLITTFTFLEYLTNDIEKISIITRIKYKIYDYTYLMLFQYHFVWITLSFVLLYASHLIKENSHINSLLVVGSLLTMCRGAHLSISQPFKIKKISELYRLFERYPLYNFKYKDTMQEKFDMLCDFEDKTYFQRKNSYSSFTREFIYYSINRKKSFALNNSKKVVLKRIAITLNNIWTLRRGFSTPEMQLIRTIGIVRGYEKYKISRKIYEIVYSKIFFDSLKKYHETNTYLNLEHYRHYLLFVYFQTVLTRINGQKCDPFSAAFTNSKDIDRWSMDGLFIACLGLNFSNVNDNCFEVFSDIIKKYNLDIKNILKLNTEYPTNKFPSIYSKIRLTCRRNPCYDPRHLQRPAVSLFEIRACRAR